MRVGAMTDGMAEELLRCIAFFQRGPGRPMRDVSEGEMAMMGLLLDQHREITPTELSETLDLSTARVTNTLNSLERKGLVRRVRDTADRRRVLVSVTAHGRSTAERRHREAIEQTRSLIADLGERDAVELIRIMTKVQRLIQRKEALHDASPMTG